MSDSDTKTYPVFPDISRSAHIDDVRYETLYANSVTDPDQFWAKIAGRIDWIRPFSKVSDTSFDVNDFRIKWFEDGKLNVCANCVDRHLESRSDQTAIIWEGDEPDISQHITYAELYDRVCRMANVLKAREIAKGDRVIIYMPMIPEAAIAMLACARIGAIHSVVFGGFSPEALAARIEDCDAKCIITADEAVRGGKSVPLKENVDAALARPDSPIRTVLVWRHTANKVGYKEGRDLWLNEAMDDVHPDCAPEPMNAEDPLFILYTSGSTGKPKGVLHTTGGYITYAAYTHETVFDYQAGEIYWCTADVGWVTGHTYIVYGPLANGATTIMFEGIPTYPDAGRFWQVVAKHQVNIFYTAPTAIRALMREGDAFVTKHDRSSIRILGTVGEPINPEAWRWYYDVVGNASCPIVDTWWQTETGGALITPLPGATDLKPGSASKPFFGIQPDLVDAEGNFLSGATEGNLVLKGSWPGQMRTVYGDHKRFIETYFTTYPGLYFTGDGAKRDEDGYFWITGRVDDVLNVSGHRMGTAEIESALVAHKDVAEAAVVGVPHDIKGQGIYCFVILNAGIEQTEKLHADLIQQVRTEIGPIAKPDFLQFVPGLPKTRSGKIMRRILRKIACNEFENLGDTSTLADPSVVDALIDGRLNR